MKKAIIFHSLLFLSVFAQAFPGVQEQINAAFKTGNATELSKHFAAEVDLAILDDEDIISKTEATAKLKAFFKNHPPNSFNILHNSTSKMGMMYAIGTLSTASGNFRVSYYLKKQGEKFLIEKLIIDGEE